jgi:monoamine oxidase
MRLSLKVNGSPRVVAAVNGPGYLSAHLNLCDCPKDNDYSKVIRVVGTQTLETEMVRSEWPKFDLQVGDTAELSLLNDGEGDPPSSVRRSSELGPALRNVGDPSAPDWPVGAAKAYGAITMTEFLREQGASPGAIELLDLPFATAADDRISFLFNLREDWYASQETTRYKIKGGNDLLPKAFAATLKENIRYGSPVVRIEQDSDKVRAIALQSATHQTFEADRLICTIPFPALRSVEIHPPFSESKRKAITQLSYDTITRVIFQCRSRYWEQDSCNGFGISDFEQEIWHPTFDQPGPCGLLVSYMCLSAGQRAGAMDDDKRLEFVSGDMEKVHPGLRENLEGAVSKVWHTDPWAGGATALPSPGQLTSICVGIERPEGRVHFAGEHTSRFQGWMQGALQSAIRVAKEVNRRDIGQYYC